MIRFPIKGTQFLSEATQFHRRMNLEFLHDAGAMRLDRSFGSTQFTGDFLVHFAGDDQREDFAFPRREAVKLALEFAPARILSKQTNQKQLSQSKRCRRRLGICQ